MRGLRSDRENFRDFRIGYTLFLVMSAICVISALIASRLDMRLRENELESCYVSLAQCGDCLEAWSEAASAQDKLSAALRFKSEVSGLPQTVKKEPLFELAQAMLENREEAQKGARALAQTFKLLAGFEYEDAERASELIAKTLHNVTSSVLVTQTPTEQSEEVVADPANVPDTSRFSYNAANQTLAALFSHSKQAIKCLQSEDEDSWIAKTDNLRVKFSCFDGSLESLVYVRLGKTPEIVCTQTELAECAEHFAKEKLRLGSAVSTNKVGELGSFSVLELECSRGLYRTVIDSSGRVWSVTKVKR